MYTLKSYGKVKDKYSWLEFNEEIEVSINALNNFCSDNSISKIDLINIDVQGAELMVLKE